MWGMPRASMPLCHRQRSNSPRLAREAHQTSGELPSCHCVHDKGACSRSRRLCLDKNVTGPINNDSGMAVKVHAMPQDLIRCSSE